MNFDNGYVQRLCFYIKLKVINEIVHVEVPQIYLLKSSSLISRPNVYEKSESSGKFLFRYEDRSTVHEPTYVCFSHVTFETKLRRDEGWTTNY